jgi:hypothetical protein
VPYSLDSRLLNFESEFKSLYRWTLNSLAWEWAMWNSLYPSGSPHVSFSLNPAVSQEAGYTALVSMWLCVINSTSEWKWNFWFWCFFNTLPCPICPPPLIAKISYETEKSCWRLTPSIKLRSTDLLIFKCLLSIAVKFCIFCKLFFPNSRCLKSLYIWFFYIPLFSTKCGFYLE